MRLEIRLERLLSEIGMTDHGRLVQIAEETGIHRVTLSRLCKNEMKQIPVAAIEAISDYLVHKGIAPERLPQALFGAQPAELWSAVKKANAVTFYLGEYIRIDGPMPARRSVSRRDASVVTDFFERLWADADSDPSGKRRVLIEYLPFHFSGGEKDLTAEQFDADAAGAKRLYERVRNAAADTVHVMVGSCRCNYLTECFVADLFGCDPFPENGGAVNVPFCFVSRPDDRDVRSVFTRRTPPGSDEQKKTGIWYLSSGRGGQRWVWWPWQEGVQNGGVVVVARDAGTGATTVALMGFSGTATSKIGSRFLQNTDEFWPPKAEKGGRKVGVYICKLAYAKKRPGDTGEEPRVKQFDVEPMATAVLRDHLA